MEDGLKAAPYIMQRIPGVFSPDDCHFYGDDYMFQADLSGRAWNLVMRAFMREIIDSGRSRFLGYKGGIYVVCGPSYSGKSTFIRDFIKENGVQYATKTRAFFDATLLTPQDRAWIVAFAQAMSVPIHACYCGTEYDLNNRIDERWRQVIPRNVVESQRKRWVKPTTDEGFNTIITF